MSNQVVFDQTLVDLEDVRSIMIVVSEDTGKRLRICYHDGSTESVRGELAVEDYLRYIQRPGAKP